MRRLRFKVGDVVTAGDTLQEGSKCHGLITGRVVTIKPHDDCPYGIMFIEHERMYRPNIHAHVVADFPYFVYESSIKLKTDRTNTRAASVAACLFD